MELVPIGIIHSPYRSKDEAPHQGRLSPNVVELEVYPEFLAGLKDLDDVKHIIVLYWCHLADREVLQTVTPHGPEVRGVFATRSPARPNPIAFCAARLVGRKDNRLQVVGVEALDGSPLLDIKPYVSDVDSISGVGPGWFKTDKLRS